MRDDKERRNAGMLIFDAATTLDIICLARSARIKTEYSFVAADALTEDAELALYRMEDEFLGLLLKTEE